MPDPQLQELKRGLPREGESLSPRAFRADYKIDPATGCWVWQKYMLRGYGRVTIKGVPQWAHRAYYERANGPLPPYPAAVIDHLCRNPSCVNPKHLEAVIPQTNIHRGNAAKLTMEIARDVRRRVQAGESSAKIKADLGVSIQNVWWIAEDLAWREDPAAPRQPVWPERNCIECGEDITGKRDRRARFCSPHHRKLYGQRRRWRLKHGLDLETGKPLEPKQC